MAGALFATAAARAGLLERVNAIRASGCAGEKPAVQALRPSGALDEAASRIAEGTGLGGAIEQSGFPASLSTTIHQQGPDDEEEFGALLERTWCRSLSDPRYTDAGFHRSGGVTWIVLAARVDPPAAADAPAVEARVLELVNAARAAPRRCGETLYEAVAPLRLSTALSEAAAAHARDMAEHATLNHRGSDGSSASARISRAGYLWRATGENIAAGQSGPEQVVGDWLKSPGHCANIMKPEFTEMGVAFSGTWWAQEFATPR